MHPIRANRAWTATIALLLLPHAAPGQLASDATLRPPLTPIHSMGDYSFLVDPAQRTDIWDRLKFIRLGDSIFLTLGAEYRLEHEVFRNSNWGAGPQDGTGYLLQRIMPHACIRMGSALRVFVSLKFDDVFGRNGGPRPGFDRNRADIHEGFVDLGTGTASVTARLGRQELIFGAGKFTSNNEGVNVRLSFDAARVTLKNHGWETNLFAGRPVSNLPGTFDDTPNHRQAFWGVYATAPPLRQMRVDGYYLGLDTKLAQYQQGRGHELRHTVGSRLYTKPAPGGIDFDGDAAWQFGTFGPDTIRAWTVATETGYRWGFVRFRPRVAMKADVASGDGNPSDHSLGTFNPLFPKGGYFGKMVLGGPYNFCDVHPVLQAAPSRTVTVQADWDWFWRQSIRDGIYGGGFRLRDGLASRARAIGSQGNMEVRWMVDRHLTVVLNLATFLSGPYLKETGPAKTVLFANSGFTYRF